MTPLDFDTEREEGTESWARSDPLHAAIRHEGGDEWAVKLPGGSWHTVRLRRERGAWEGAGDCKGWQYRDDDGSPCAHLCAVRRAHWCARLGWDAGLDVHGDPVRVPTVDELRAPDPDPEREAIADGGHGDETREDYLAARADEVLRE